MAAASICQDPTRTAFWVWTRTVTRATGAVTRWQRVISPPYECLGGDDPVVAPVPLHVRIEAVLARGFADLPLPRGDVEVRPSGTTLINVDTRFFTATGTQSLRPVSILGAQVTVRAKAERYDWYWGDGQDSQDAGAGSESAPVNHEYTRAGHVGPYVVVTWSGTFMIAGDPKTYLVQGTATTTGPPADLTVTTARSELVSK